MSSKLMSESVSSISPTTALWGGGRGMSVVCVRGGGVRWGGCQYVGVRAFLHNTVESHLSEHVGTKECSDN